MRRVFFYSQLIHIFASDKQRKIMPKKESDYRQSIEEIERILSKIENGETDIDDLTSEIKRAAKLLQDCKERLFQTELEIEKIMKGEE